MRQDTGWGKGTRTQTEGAKGWQKTAGWSLTCLVKIANEEHGEGRHTVEKRKHDR